MTKYRYHIGLDKYPYGQELEFVNVSLQKLDKSFQKTNIPIEFMLNHKKSDTVYDKNYLDEDGTVSYQQGNIIYGGEISSRLYHDQKKDWTETEQICDTLTKNGAQIDNHCSNHINIDLSPVKKMNIFMETLSKLVATHEIEISFFYMGDSYYERLEKDTYARPIRSNLFHKVNKINFREDDNYMYELQYRRYATFTRRDGISLQDYRKNGRMEIRYPNGTLNKKIIQNNTNFSLKLVNAIEEERFDIERLTYEINEDLEKDRYWYDYRSEEEHYKRFESLANTIATSIEDQNDFMGQYEKVLSTKLK